MLLFVTLCMFFFLVVGPQRLWRNTVAWAFRHPEHIEPSDNFYTAVRSIVGVITVVLFFSSLIRYCALPESMEQRFADAGGVPLEFETNTEMCEVLHETFGYVFDGDEDVVGTADYDLALVSEAVMVTFGGELEEVQLNDDGSGSVSFSFYSGDLTGTYLRRDDGTDSIECS